ncbi:hypothetical protein OS175_00130 [Marinicella sp. S1101]|uniref:hypothetical protein n=1 Tax=Marinicella marina TaxID=2996016 RepID=UPI002260FA89|nr:hypothetical protein [Marinicella marina]MCX7552268.1 hypothetical protein [Marinicella marina]MDJ1139144.1 hypothetical protein [Marinicella marina]
MSFQEKSAWVMVVGLVVSTVLYAFLVYVMSSAAGQLVPLHIPVLVAFTVVLTLIAVVGHIVIAIFSPKEANARADEREQRIIDKSGYLSSNVLGFGVITSLMVYLFFYNGELLFYGVFGSLIVAQILEYMLQIYYQRRAI